MSIEQTKSYKHVTADAAGENLFDEVSQSENFEPGKDDDDDYAEKDINDLTDATLKGSEPDLDADTPPLNENDLEENDLAVEEADDIEWEPGAENDVNETEDFDDDESDE